MRWRRDSIEYPRGYRANVAAPYTARIWAILVITVLVLGVLAGRLFQLQVVDGPAMKQAAQRINTRTVDAPATRGRILAADGTPLVHQWFHLGAHHGPHDPRREPGRWARGPHSRPAPDRR